jgi:hypothetical protein
MSAIPERDQFAAKGVAETLHRESRHYVAPIWWGTDPYDANTQMRSAFSSMALKTGSSSPGELAMTCSTSSVAACRSKAIVAEERKL